VLLLVRGMTDYGIGASNLAACSMEQRAVYIGKVCEGIHGLGF